MKLWEVLEFSNDNGVLLYKHECEDFFTNSKLIVREGQVAVFLKNGVLYDSFKPGKYTLKTQNIPLLTKAINAVTTGGENSFSAELFFISTIDQMNLKWGTRTPMLLRDPNYNVIVKVGACGESIFSVVDPLLFVKRISGTAKQINSDQLGEYFRSIINTFVKNCISDALTVNRICILDMNSCLLRISDACCAYLNEQIAEYGIKANNFTVDSIHIPDDDPSIAKLKNILAKKAEMDILGYTYREERSFNVMDNATSNLGNGGIAGSLMGIGLGFGLASPIAKEVTKVAGIVDANSTTPSPQPQTNGWNCSCGAKNVLSNFCPNCGNKKPLTSLRDCPNCGAKEITSAFCPSCGYKMSDEKWNCPCGTNDATSDLCPNCGGKRPADITK